MINIIKIKNKILFISTLIIILLAAVFSSCDLFMSSGSIYIQWDDELGYIIANGEEYSTSPVKLLPDFDNLNIDFKFHSTDIEKIWTFDSWDVFEVKDMFVTVAHDSYYTERNSEISIEKDVYYEFTAKIRKSNEFYLGSSSEVNKYYFYKKNNGKIELYKTDFQSNNIEVIAELPENPYRIDEERNEVLLNGYSDFFIYNLQNKTCISLSEKCFLNSSKIDLLLIEADKYYFWKDYTEIVITDREFNKINYKNFSNYKRIMNIIFSQDRKKVCFKSQPSYSYERSLTVYNFENDSLIDIDLVTIDAERNDIGAPLGWILNDNKIIFKYQSVYLVDAETLKFERFYQPKLGDIDISQIFLSPSGKYIITYGKIKESDTEYGKYFVETVGDDLIAYDFPEYVTPKIIRWNKDETKFLLYGNGNLNSYDIINKTNSIIFSSSGIQKIFLNEISNTYVLQEYNRVIKINEFGGVINSSSINLGNYIGFNVSVDNNYLILLKIIAHKFDSYSYDLYTFNIQTGEILPLIIP